jgi:hypothetical protein
MVIACVGFAIYLGDGVDRSLSGAHTVMRDFYGSLKVSDAAASGHKPAIRTLYNGAVEHGVQILNPARRREPTAYYGHETGIGQLLDAEARRGPLRVGVIGLGSGTLAAYGRGGDDYRFYEINPQAIAIAHRWFTYLRDSPAATHIITGDARLSLQHEPSNGFNVLAADAFTGDTVPTHLLTVEAFRLYFRHLRPDGVLAVHISSLYLNLGPIVAKAAESLGKMAVLLENVDDKRKAVYASDWALVSSDRTLLRHLVKVNEGEYLSGRGVRLWTDNYIDLTEAIA